MAIEHNCCPHDEIVSRASITAAGIAKAAKIARAPKVSFTADPLEGGRIAYLKLGAKNKKSKAQTKVVIAFRLKNNEPKRVTLTGVTFSFPGSGHPDRVMKAVSREIKPGEAQWWSNGNVKVDDDEKVKNVVYLNPPAPSKVKVALSFAGFLKPVTFAARLTPYVPKVTGGSFLFPLSAGDMRAGEYARTSAVHWANGGGAGHQIFAHDIGVAAWDSAKKELSATLPKTTGKKNDHFRIWGKSVRAMADGEVESWREGMKTNTVTKKLPNPTPSPVGGNHFWIRHGDVSILYAHLQKGTLPKKLMKKGAPVKAGETLGKAGNSGNSNKPHLHIHAKGTDAQASLRPLPLRDAWVVTQSSLKPPSPEGPWVRLLKQGIPAEPVDIWSAPTVPAWYPPGWAEISHHAFPEAGYQALFDRAVGAGYRPVFLDGYTVKGANYFNVIFRPADGVTWAARHGMTGAKYQQEFNSWTKKGMRPLNVCSYISKGHVRYAAIFVKAAGPSWTAAHGLTLVAFNKTHADWTKKGYRPVNVSVVAPALAPRFTLLYEKTNVGKYALEPFLTPARYQQKWSQHTKAGLHLSYLSACGFPGGARFAAIFQKKAPGSGGTVGRHHLNSKSYQTEYNKWLGQGPAYPNDRGLPTQCHASIRGRMASVSFVPSVSTATARDSQHRLDAWFRDSRTVARF